MRATNISEETFYRTTDEDFDGEYIDGRIIMHSPASNRHEDVFRFLLTLLSTYVGERSLGEVRGSRYPMRLDKRWSPEPDLMFVLNGHRPRMTPKWLDGPADFVLEITSESDPQFEYRKKLPRYRAAGIPEIWIVDPLKGHVHVESTNTPPRILKTGRLTSKVVEEFWIDVGWLWRSPLPPPLPCLMRILNRHHRGG